MELEVLGRRVNPLLRRTEVRFRVRHEGAATPRREEVREALGKALGAPKEAVVVDGMASTFGRGESVGYAKVYESAEAALRVERPHVLVRNKLAEKAPKEAKAAPAAKPAPAAAAKAKGGKAVG